MKRFGQILIVTLAVALEPSAHGQTPVSCQPGDFAAKSSISWEQAVATQDRVNRYFHHDVIPRLAGCWDRLSKGTLVVRFQYQRSGDRWFAGRSTLQKSTLPKDQASLAFRCLQEAVVDSSFPVDASDGDSTSYLVSWSFPVPWPKDDAEAIIVALDNGGGTGSGGGCGGPENPPACYDCHYIHVLGGISLCVPTCAGYAECQKIPNGCYFPGGTRCITGRVNGNLGGVVIY